MSQKSRHSPRGGDERSPPGGANVDLVTGHELWLPPTDQLPESTGAPIGLASRSAVPRLRVGDR